MKLRAVAGIVCIGCLPSCGGNDTAVLPSGSGAQVGTGLGGDTGMPAGGASATGANAAAQLGGAGGTGGGATGVPGAGGIVGLGGAVSSGGGTGLGGAAAVGGSVAMGGSVAAGGTVSTGGVVAVGGTPTGGAQSTGGAAPTGGAEATGGSQPTGGAAPTGGAEATGGDQATGGTVATGGSEATGGGGSTDPFEEARQACVDRINAFRATEGTAPLERWTDGEACADEQAQLDGEANAAHGNFGMCDESAQNTCPWWPSLDSIIQDCLQMMWDEGPGEPYSEHGHYINMSNPDYTMVACGFYQDANGEVWASQNFR